MNNSYLKRKSMLYRLIIITLIALSGSLKVWAQEKCLIQGVMLNDSLRYAREQIKQVYLTRMDEYERFFPIDSAVVENGKFTFTYHIDRYEPVMLYFITGFDNGSVSLFIEPGEVKVRIPQAAYPSSASVSGTKTNDLYAQYKAIGDHCIRLQIDSLQQIEKLYGKEWMNTAESFDKRNQIGAAALIECNAERLNLLLEHNDSPLAPLMMERELLHMVSMPYAEQMLKALSPAIENHPYYRSFNNAVRALDLKVGGELPNITIPLAEGGTAYLSDYRGKYVLLDFWASWCAPCMREMPFLKQLYAETQDYKDRFVILSFSIDNKERAWVDAIKNKEIALPGWVHGSDLLGWGSPAARMMGVTAVPKTILIDPDGKAISFSLRGEEMVRRIKQILAGDLYYLQQK